MAVANGAWGRVVLPGASEALDGLRRRGPAYWTSHGLALPNGPTTAPPPGQNRGARGRLRVKEGKITGLRGAGRAYVRRC
jgi:hypothetical protein